MIQIDFKKTFSKLSHIKALSHDHKFEEIVQNLITHTLYQISDKNIKNEIEVAKLIKEIYGISIRTPIILSNLDKLIHLGEIKKDQISKSYHIVPNVSNRLKQRIEEAKKLEIEVKEKWFSELKTLKPDYSPTDLDNMWECLSSYLCKVFEQHGIQTLNLLVPDSKSNKDSQDCLSEIISKIANENKEKFSQDTLSFVINSFITNADEKRTDYISQLADSAFTSFALTSDAETVNFLNQRFNNLLLLLDTNFIFGILDLHKNMEDASAREILEEVKKNNLPFRLGYHPETLSEFKRAFDVRALRVKASKWTTQSSRVALAVDGLNPLEELFHKYNIDNEIDPDIFLDKYEHVDIILKDMGLIEFTPQELKSDEEYSEIDNDVENYKSFYESIPYKKDKSYLGYKHDIVVLREVRKLNPQKRNFLDSKAFFISSDYTLIKFEKDHYKKKYEINYVVSPSIFLQLIRPFIENDYASNKRFIDTFSIPEFRSFEIDYTTTRSKALQILNDNYHNASFETKVKILRDQVLLEKLEKANDDYAVQCEIIESQIAVENQILIREKEEAYGNIKQISMEKIKIEEEKNIAIAKMSSNSFELIEKGQEIENLKKENQKLSIANKEIEIESLNDWIILQEEKQKHLELEIEDKI
ncbi:MAG: hypothetical protein PHO80_05855, partial [Candidatus Gracilibacteria bacterium]|nr:hypothetical protein [Candidatus Gracilibacteria bacterium]